MKYAKTLAPAFSSRESVCLFLLVGNKGLCQTLSPTVLLFLLLGQLSRNISFLLDCGHSVTGSIMATSVVTPKETDVLLVAFSSWTVWYLSATILLLLLHVVLSTFDVALFLVEEFFNFFDFLAFELLLINSLSYLCWCAVAILIF